jgi:hypothetical protein
VKIKAETVHLKEELCSVIDGIGIGDESQIVGIRRKLADDVIHGYNGIPGVSGGKDVIGSNDLSEGIRKEEYVVILTHDMNVCLIACLCM